jgi:uncharacterized delta-60 repeat protein
VRSAKLSEEFSVCLHNRPRARVAPPYSKYNLNGSLDTAFGVGGIVTTDIPGRQNYINGLTIQPDGKIVAARPAYSIVGASDFAVVRYNSDGSPDISFGSAGIVVTDFYGQQDVPAGGLALQADGRIVLASLANDASYVALARYMP